MKKSAILTLALVLALGVSQAYGDSPPIKPVEIVNQPVDVNVVNQSPIAVDANVAFPATQDVNIVNTEPISTTPEVRASNIVNVYKNIPAPGGGTPWELYTVPAGKTFFLTDVIDSASPTTEPVLDQLCIGLVVPGGFAQRACLNQGFYSFRSSLVFSEGETIGALGGGLLLNHAVTVTGFLQ